MIFDYDDSAEAETEARKRLGRKKRILSSKEAAMEPSIFGKGSVGGLLAEVADEVGITPKDAIQAVLNLKESLADAQRRKDEADRELKSYIGMLATNLNNLPKTGVKIGKVYIVGGKAVRLLPKKQAATAPATRPNGYGGRVTEEEVSPKKFDLEVMEIEE